MGEMSDRQEKLREILYQYELNIIAILEDEKDKNAGLTRGKALAEIEVIFMSKEEIANRIRPICFENLSEGIFPRYGNSKITSFEEFIRALSEALSIPKPEQVSIELPKKKECYNESKENSSSELEV